MVQLHTSQWACKTSPGFMIFLSLWTHITISTIWTSDPLISKECNENTKIEKTNVHGLWPMVSLDDQGLGRNRNGKDVTRKFWEELYGQIYLHRQNAWRYPLETSQPLPQPLLSLPKEWVVLSTWLLKSASTEGCFQWAFIWDTNMGTMHELSITDLDSRRLIWLQPLLESPICQQLSPGDQHWDSIWHHSSGWSTSLLVAG